MASRFSDDLRTYAEVIVKVGLNVQPGQRLLIGPPLLYIGSVPLELVPLVRAIVVEAYRAGARFVEVMWEDPLLQRLRLQHAPTDSLEEVAAWRHQGALEHARAGGAILSIYGQDPDLLEGLDPSGAATLQREAFKHSGPLWQLMSEGAMNWSAITAPVAGWTEKVYPELPADEAKAEFWDAIFSMCRVKEVDPINAWEDHLRQLASRSGYLNDKRFSALKLTGPGTDLTVGLVDGHLWHSGALSSQAGVSFTANIPTEEVFTLPHRDRIDGVVASTKPLVVEGVTIERFQLTFVGGRVVEVQADQGEAALRRLLDTDDGARSAGEIALVPHSSPISQTGRVFYNIIIDENASNHLALGNGYRFNLRDGEAMSGEEFAAAGGNSSLIHTDFMIGSAQMNVDGVTQGGEVEPVMRGGEWAFELSH